MLRARLKPGPWARKTAYALDDCNNIKNDRTITIIP